MKIIINFLVISILVLFALLNYQKIQNSNSNTNFYIETPPVKEHYIGKVKLNNRTTVRLLVLKHSFESVADGEEREIVQAANLAASKGLKIKDIGSHHIDGGGKVAYKIKWGKKCSLSNLKNFVSEQMKISARKGDTLIIYTTGHGGAGGYLQSLGDRKTIAKAFADAAEENNQETLWWQSSCYAAAGLPPISSFNKKQQKLFSMIASSNAYVSSYWGDQTYPMQQVFLALAKDDPKLDKNKNGLITAGELKSFLNTVKRNADCILFYSSLDEIIFGRIGPWDIPIIDRNNVQGNYNDNYYAVPNE